MDKRDRIYDYLENLDNDDYLEIVNEYQSKNNLDTVYPIDEFDSELDSFSPSEIADMVTDGNYSSSDEYFTYDNYTVTTYSDLCEVEDYDAIADYIIEHDDSLGNGEIRDILDDSGEKTIIVHFGDEAEEYTKEEFASRFGATESQFYNRETNAVWSVSGVLSLFEEEDEDFSEGDELWVVDIGWLLRSKGKEHICTILSYTGWVFDSGEYDDGRPFYWFYVPEQKYLLKLVYNHPVDLDSIEASSPKYIMCDRLNASTPEILYIVSNC